MPRSIGAARGATVAKKEVRSDRDFYETPVPCAVGICGRMKKDFFLEPKVVLEPSCGSGSFIEAIRIVWPNARIIAVDILASNVAKSSAKLRRTDTIIRGDIMDVSDDLILSADAVVGNPPFSHAEEHIERLLRAMAPQVRLDFLLPTSFITTQGRAERLYNNPPDGRGDARGPYGELEAQMPLAGRPGFTLNGKTDMAEYAAYIFQKDKGSHLPHLLPHCWWKR